MRPPSVPCCGESARARKSGHRTWPGTRTRRCQRRPMHPIGPHRMARSRRRADPRHHRRPRPPPATRRQDRGNQRRRHHLHPGRRMAPAGHHTGPLHDPPVRHRRRPRDERPEANWGRAHHRREVPPALTLSGAPFRLRRQRRSSARPAPPDKQTRQICAHRARCLPRHIGRPDRRVRARLRRGQQSQEVIALSATGSPAWPPLAGSADRRQPTRAWSPRSSGRAANRVPAGHREPR